MRICKQTTTSKNMSKCPVDVVVRVRPLNKSELDINCKETIQCKYNKQISVNNKVFCYDHVFDTSATQAEIFYNKMNRIIDSSMIEGKNATIMAYGQTSSGKSYTMTGGRGSERGIIPRAIYRIVNYYPGTFSMSFVEIYQGKVRDLFCNNNIVNMLGDGTLQNTQTYRFCNNSNTGKRRSSLSNYHSKESPSKIRRTRKYGRNSLNEEICDKSEFIKPNNLFAQYNEDTKIEYNQNINTNNCIGIRSQLSDRIFALLDKANSLRKTASTKMNSSSSRSHSILSIQFDDIHGKPKLTLIDLAGSETVKKTGASGETLREASEINKSLSTLMNVLDSLSKSYKGHVSFRESKLTQFLQTSLNYDSKICLIINISPSGVHVNETMNSLRFGERAKRITLPATTETDERLKRDILCSLQIVEEELNEWQKHGPTPLNQWLDLGTFKNICESSSVSPSPTEYKISPSDHRNDYKLEVEDISLKNNIEAALHRQNDLSRQITTLSDEIKRREERLKELCWEKSKRELEIRIEDSEIRALETQLRMLTGVKSDKKQELDVSFDQLACVE